MRARFVAAATPYSHGMSYSSANGVASAHAAIA
jgi:hypothetical protein